MGKTAGKPFAESHKMNNITVIFDLGNVMVYFDYGRLVHKLAHAYDLKESFIYQQKAQLENILKGFENGEISPEIFTHKVSSALNRKLEVAEFKKIWSEIFTENVEVTEIVRELKGKARLLAMSNTDTWHFEYLEENFNFLDLFDDVILSFRLGYGKPDKRIFERAIELSQGSTEILYFDDIPEYVVEAKKLGIKAYQFTDGNQLRRILRDVGLL